VRSHPIRVSIDLETTGLQPDTDTIIEIAAVKFRGAQVIGTFQTFVSTHRPIPYRVQRLTGITQADLQHAPHFEEVAPRLRAFLGRAALVGHSVPFDAAFLRKRGLAQENPLLDTFELATVLLPALPSYTLERVAESLEVVGDVFHRAMADAVLAKDVFLALLARIEQLDLSVLEELALLGGRLSWPLLSLFADERRARSAGRSTPAGWASVGEQLSAKLGVNPQVFSLGIARAAGETSEAPARAIQRVATATAAADVPATAEEIVPGQALQPGAARNLAIEAALTHAFETLRPLLLEVEPDNKGLASSLLTALRWTQAHAKPLVIAAANAGACRRLAQETLPALQAQLSQPLKVEFLAEPENYLCLHRWYGAGRTPRNGELPADITRGLAKLTLWLHYSATGIRDELVLMQQEQSAWEMVRSGPEYLDDLLECPYARSGYCFTRRSREAAAQANVIVTTHAALLEYLGGDVATLGDMAHLLILDAQLLEEEAIRQGSYELSKPALSRLLDELLTGQPEAQQGGLLVLAMKQLEQMQAGITPKGGQLAEARLPSWQALMERTRQGVEHFFAALSLMLSEYHAQHHGGPRSWNEGVEPSLRLSSKVRNGPGWKGVEQAWAELESGLPALIARLERLIALLQGSQVLGEGQRAGGAKKSASSEGRPSLEGPAGTLAVELRGVCFRLRHFVEQGSLAMSQPRKEMVYWVKPPLPPPPPRAASGAYTNPPPENPLPEPSPSLHAAPAHAGPLLQNTLFREHRAAVLVASALTVSGEFDYAIERFGLTSRPPETLSVAPEEQPQTLLYLPEDVAEPNTPHYQRHLDAMLVQLATALHGETVVLFASHAALRAGYAGIKAILEERDILVLAQGIDGSLRQLWQTFRSQERVVLLGAGSFWENTDLLGDGPACVVVTRLPFPALSDPPLAGRAEGYHDQLRQFVIPQAALRLRHALNRLAWGGSRRNALVLFDKRVQAKDYGGVFLNSLPRCTTRQGSVSLAPEHVAGWMRGEAYE
jgi:ATP-dependent DNA helicase DinG